MPRFMIHRDKRFGLALELSRYLKSHVLPMAGSRGGFSPLIGDILGMIEKGHLIQRRVCFIGGHLFLFSFQLYWLP
jgi:hypothetical protein